jgi:hypothetical protein
VRRREFITLLGGAAAAWPLRANAQQPKLPIVGFLGSGTPANQGLSSSAFAQRLRELGWIEGRTFALEYRWTEGRSERYAEFAAEFVRLKVDVIFTTGTPAAVAAKRATSLIPIVFAGAANPVGGGLVASTFTRAVGSCWDDQNSSKPALHERRNRHATRYKNSLTMILPALWSKSIRLTLSSRLRRARATPFGSNPPQASRNPSG